MSVNAASSSKTWLGIIPVVIHGKGKDIATCALIDSGANVTLVRQDIFNELGVPGEDCSLGMMTVDGFSQQVDRQKATLNVSSVDGQGHVKLNVYTTDTLNIGLNSCRRDLNQWEHLKHIPLPEIKNDEVGLLIGTDTTEMFWTHDERRGAPKEPFARKTSLGWIVIGPVERNNGNKQVNHARADPLLQQLERQWLVDFPEVADETRLEMSKDDRKAFKVMEDTVQVVNGKYTVAIPWRIDPTSLPNNLKVAETRLRHLKRKLSNDETLHEQYTTTVEKYIADGHARRLAAKEMTDVDGLWYLPHHPVFKKSNSSKCRVVFDCAATYQGTSLNDAILQGPNMMNNLAGVLIRFRTEPVAVVADIEAMFHQCRVPRDDQRFLRFLWWPEGNLAVKPEVYAMTVHLFGATSSPSVAGFCMQKTANDNEKEFSENAIATLRRAFYVDDMLKSVGSVAEGIELFKDMSALLQRGGFRLTKWLSTHRDVLDTIPEEEKIKSLQAIDLNDNSLPSESALGLQWNVELHAFMYDVDLPDKPLTKRGLLSMTSSLYDPLGFVGPVVLVPKLIQQELCANNWTGMMQSPSRWPQIATNGYEMSSCSPS